MIKKYIGVISFIILAASFLVISLYYKYNPIWGVSWFYNYHIIAGVSLLFAIHWLIKYFVEEG